MLRLCIVAVLAVTSFLAVPALAVVVTTFSLDTHDPADDDLFSGPVYTSTLDAGQPYLITVSGTFSFWAASAWGEWTGTNASNVCAGQAEELPQTQSPGATNGPVGIDPEYAFAWVKLSPSLCPGGSPVASPPVHLESLQIGLDGGTTWQHIEPLSRTYSLGHSYQYLVVGLGFPAAIGMRRTDFPTSDNYGVLTATVEATDPSPFVRGIGGVTNVDGADAEFWLMARERNDGVRGRFEYEDLTGKNVTAQSLTSLLVLKSTNTAYLMGYASVDGDSGHPFTLIVQDNGRGNDTFRLDVDGSTVASGTLTGGNLQVRAK